MEEAKCALCNSEDYTEILTGKDYRFKLTNECFNIVQCDNCGLVYLNPRPPKEEMTKFYPNDYYGQQNPATRVYVRLLQTMKIRRIMKYKKKGRILDIGCGDGEFLLCFKKKGWETYGVEVSKTAFQLAKNKLKQNIFNYELGECNFSDNYFDVVTLIHVLEHLHNPSETLKEIYRILHKEGIVYMSMPNINSFQFKASKEHWFHLDLPRHLYHYSSTTIKYFTEKNGFKVIELTYPLFDFPLDVYYSLKDKWQSNYSKLLLVITLLLKLVPQWRGSMELIIAKKRVKESTMFKRENLRGKIFNWTLLLVDSVANLLAHKEIC